MIERMVLVMGIAMLATLTATSAIFAPLTGTP